jgi:stearoyl-CoA desaturase (delta-9 desaturase)
VTLRLVGITMGYHRLWSHRTYTARWPLRFILAILGTLSFQGSIKWWSERHRLHHRFTDSDHDPYDARRGFWFSHMGWIFQKPYYRKLPLVDVSDLTKDPSKTDMASGNFSSCAFSTSLLCPPRIILWFRCARIYRITMG